MATLRLLDGAPEQVQGLVISAEPPNQLARLVTQDGEEVASTTIQAKKAKAWAKREQKKLRDTLGEDEFQRLGYANLELRIYD